MTATMPAQAAKGKQISVFLDDTPGSLAKVCRLLGDARINIHALSLAEGLGHGYVRMVVDRHPAACELLRKNGYLFFEKDVLLVEVANSPGGLAAITERWCALGINLEYAYCAGGPRVDHGLVVVKVDRTDEALDAVRGGGGKA